MSMPLVTHSLDRPNPLDRGDCDPLHRVHFRTFEDCDQLAEMVAREAEARFTQLSAGEFRGATRRLELGDLRLHHTRSTGRTLNRARLSEHYVYYHIPIRARQLSWDGTDLPEPVLLQHWGADDFIRRGCDLEFVVVAGPRERLIRTATALAGVSDECARARAILDPRSPAARSLVETALDAARQASQLTSDQDSTETLEALRVRLDRALVDLLVEQIRVHDERPPPPASRKKIVLRAEQVLSDAGARRVSVAELCRAVGVSGRTLEYAFQEVCGVTPQRLMQLQRLRSARQTLRRAEPERGAVKRAAYEAGFRELGRFSVDYRRFFGESPSQTLSR